MAPENIIIRTLATLDEFQQCCELQKMIWGDTDRELVPLHIFIVAEKTGGQIFGVYDNDRLVGYLLAFAGAHAGQIYLHSHMTGVHPDYQNCGIGRKLKLAQRAEALGRGINLIKWTFDPLKLRNAHFNIVRLGAIVRNYLPDVYGKTASHLDQGLPTDRLLAEWHLDSPRVMGILQGQLFQPPANCHRIFVPVEKQTLAGQTEIRQQFQALFAQGLVVTGLELNNEGMSYLLQADAGL